ncbi:MAG: hypothetical protein ACRECH_10810 [Nitrososphaerales archaeon]
MVPNGRHREVGVAKAYAGNTTGTLVLTIPKEAQVMLDTQRGTKVVVKCDGKKSIYELA